MSEMDLTLTGTNQAHSRIIVHLIMGKSWRSIWIEDMYDKTGDGFLDNLINFVGK